MLVSVHLPKTAGTSFLLTLEAHFGERLRKDYADRPINKGSLRRNSQALYACARNRFSGGDAGDLACIHGHFLPLKYRCLPGPLDFVTWMRDPLERMLSHYHYWQRSFEPDSSGELHRRMVEENWSLERFCLGPELQNIYAKFLWGFPLESFSFIGITEYYQSDMEYFSRRFLGVDMEPERVNVSSGSDKDGALQDREFCERVARHHSLDIGLYRTALNTRAARLQGNAAEGGT